MPGGLARRPEIYIPSDTLWSERAGGDTWRTA